MSFADWTLNNISTSKASALNESECLIATETVCSLENKVFLTRLARFKATANVSQCDGSSPYCNRRMRYDKGRTYSQSLVNCKYLVPRMKGSMST